MRPDLLMIGPLPDWDMQPLEADYQVHRLWEADDKEALLSRHEGAIRAIATKGELGADAALIARLPKLEIIACYGVGVDAIDLAAARARGIPVTNTPGVLTGDVADLAMGLVLAVARQIPGADAYVRQGRWAAGSMDLVTRVHGKKIGICGFGRIGKTIARRAAGFDMEIGYFRRQKDTDSPHRFFPTIAGLAAWCDYLVISLAGGAGTQKLVDAGALAALRPESFLINVSRGSTIDETALLDALVKGRIAGAALDVFWNEPHIDARFLALPNVVLQPHAASGTVETRRAMGQLMRDNLAAHFAGRPLPTPIV